MQTAGPRIPEAADAAFIALLRRPSKNRPPCGGGRATDCAYRSRRAETDHRHRSRRLPRRVDSRLRQLSHFWDADGRADRETGIGSWTDVEIKRAIVCGKGPSHGRLIRNEAAAPGYRLPQQHQPFRGAEADFADEKKSDPVYRG